MYQVQYFCSKCLDYHYGNCPRIDVVATGTIGPFQFSILTREKE